MSLSFANPALLWGTLLVGVPIVIHLLNRRRYRVVPWAAQRFLLEAFRRTRRRVTLESLLLLLLRCAAVALLALAMARPFVPHDSALSLLTPERRSVVLVVDRSYSMGRILQGGASCLDRARTQALSLLEGLEPGRGDEAMLVAMGDVPEVLVPSTQDLGRLRDALGRLEVGWGGADLARCLDSLVENVLAGGEREVFVFTDMQRRTIAPGGVDPEGGDTPVARAMRTAVASGARVTFVDVGEPEPPFDLSVEDLSVRPEPALAGEVVRVVASVRNHSPRPARGVLGSFFLDEDLDRPKVETFDVPPSGTAAVETSIVVPRADRRREPHVVRFQLGSDALSADDVRWFAFPAFESIRVLVVDGDAAVALPERGAGVLVDMFDPSADPETRASPYRVELADERRFNLRVFEPRAYDLVVLSNVARLDAKVAAELADAVRTGTSLWIFAGDRIDPRNWHERWLESGVLPARFLEPKGSDDPDSAAAFFPREFDELHPALRLFADPALRPAFTSVPIRRFWRLEPAAGEVRVLVRLDDDPARPSPLVVERRVGRGRVVLFATSADGSWSGFARNENVLVYLPLVQELAAWSTREDSSLRNRLVGQPVRLAARVVPRAVRIVAPDGRVVERTDPPRGEEHGEFVLPPFEETGVPGVYRVEFETAGAAASPAADLEEGRRLVAVNVDVRESDPRRLEPEALPMAFPGVEIGAVRELAGLARAEESGREGELWRTLLAAVAAALVAESLYAWWIGRRRAVAGGT